MATPPGRLACVPSAPGQRRCPAGENPAAELSSPPSKPPRAAGGSSLARRAAAHGGQCSLPPSPQPSVLLLSQLLKFISSFSQTVVTLQFLLSLPPHPPLIADFFLLFFKYKECELIASIPSVLYPISTQPTGHPSRSSAKEGNEAFKRVPTWYLLLFVGVTVLQLTCYLPHEILHWPTLHSPLEGESKTFSFLQETNVTRKGRGCLG